MIGTPVQNDDKKAGQRTLIGQNKKKNASSAVSYLSLALSHGKLRASAYRPSNVVRELWQQRRRRLWKRHLKSEVALLQTLSRLFHLVHFVKCWQLFLELNSKRLYRSSGKEKRKSWSFVHVLHKAYFHVVDVQWHQRNVQKSVIHVQSCCFANLNLSLFCRSRSWRRRHLCWNSLFWRKRDDHSRSKGKITSTMIYVCI